MRASDERLPLRQKGRVDLRETGVDLEVDHPSDESALERRSGTAQQVEARAGHFRTARDVKDPQLLADLPMWLRRERKHARLILADDRVVLVNSSEGRGRVDHVGDVKNELVALSLKRA